MFLHITQANRYQNYKLDSENGDDISGNTNVKYSILIYDMERSKENEGKEVFGISMDSISYIDKDN